jgi:hypothetical protein
MMLRSINGLLSFFLIIFLSACSKEDNNSISDSGKIKTEKSVFVMKKSIPSSGGELEVLGTQTPLEGLSIIVPEGSYSDAREFSVSYANITSHELGSYFNPISPLIEITNGGAYADKFMKLKIPLSPHPGYFRMAFYYDTKTGELEGIPLIKSEDSSITVGLRHFSFIVVTEIQKSILIQGNGFHTFFEPSTNGWSFPNYGTFPEPGGICAGMSVGAAYYFKNFSASINLGTFFDNDKLWFATPNFWEDDAKGISFATAIHKSFSLYSNNPNNAFDPILVAPEEDRFWSIIYNMLVNNQPQLIYVHATDSAVAHMIIGFAYEINSNEAKIKVYDPNYPRLENEIKFDLVSKSFKPYASASNAKALADGDIYNFNEIALFPLSSAIAVSEMDLLWNKVQNNSIGKNLFPNYKIYAVPKDNTFEKIELIADDNGIRNSIPFDEFDFELELLDPVVSSGLESIIYLPGLGPERKNPATSIKMVDKDTLIGIYIKAIPVGQQYEKWLGFDWFKIHLQDVWMDIMPNPINSEPNKEIEIHAELRGVTSGDLKYVWNFEDGTAEVVKYNDNNVKHKFTKVGDYNVKVKLYDNTNGKELASASVIAIIAVSSGQSFNFNWLQRKSNRDWFFDINFNLSGTVEGKNGNKVEQIVGNENNKIVSIKFSSIDSFLVNFTSSFSLSPLQITSTVDPKEIITYSGTPRLSWSTNNFNPPAGQATGNGTFGNSNCVGTITIKGYMDYVSTWYDDNTGEYKTTSGTNEWVLGYIQFDKY